MIGEPVVLEELLLAILSADDERRRQALRVLRGASAITAAPRDTSGPVLLRTGEAAKYLGISRTTLWRLIREGRLEQVEIRRGSHRLRKAVLDEFAASRNPQHELGVKK